MATRNLRLPAPSRARPIALALLFAATAAVALELPVTGDWQRHSFAGQTDYRVVEIDGRRALRAESRASASGLYREVAIDLNATPILQWSWRVDRLLDDPPERTRAGDDYPARVYVVNRYGWLPWQTRAINYVWSSSQPAGTSWLNAFTDRSWMVAVRGGPARLGDWVNERRDVRADFRRLFGVEVERVNVVALMTDSDNTGATLSAYYGDLRFTAR